MVYIGVVLGTDFQETPLNEVEIKQRRKFVFHVKYPSLSPIATKLTSFVGSSDSLFILDFQELP